MSVDQSFVTGTAGATHREKKVPLNGSDKLFSHLRDLNFALVGNVLSQVRSL